MAEETTKTEHEVEPTTDGERLYAGRYKSIEELEKGYTELQADYTRSRQKPTPKPAEPAGLIQPTEDTSVDQILERAGLDAGDLAAAFGTDGQLTPEQYAALKRVNPGYTKPVVDAFMGAQAARQALAARNQEQIQTHAAEIVGGQDQLDVLMAWAGRSLKPKQIDDLNRRLADPDLYESALVEVQSLHARGTNTAGSKPTITGGAPRPGATAPFGSVAEQTNAMLDKRYAPKLINGAPNPDHDPAYYKQVRARLR